jgi:hypothetical protein
MRPRLWKPWTNRCEGNPAGREDTLDGARKHPNRYWYLVARRVPVDDCGLDQGGAFWVVPEGMHLWCAVNASRTICLWTFGGLTTHGFGELCKSLGVHVNGVFNLPPEAERWPDWLASYCEERDYGGEKEMRDVQPKAVW